MPIKIIKYRFDVNIVDELLQIKWWDHSSIDMHKIVEENFFKIEEFIAKFKSIN